MIPIKILLVDDEEDLLLNLKEALRTEGYQVVTAANGHEAVERALGDKPDLILMDIMMHELDGLAACRQIKENPETANINVIFLTARDLPADLVEGLDSGAIDYITKPFSYDELFARLRSFHRLYDYQKKLSAMVEFSKAINQLDTDKLVAEAVANLTKIVRVELFSIFVYNEEENRVRILASNHPHFADFKDLELDIADTPLMREVIRRRTIVYVNEFSKSSYVTEKRGIYRDDFAIGVPLMVGERLLGVMNLNGNSYGFFDKPDYTFIKLAAEHISSAISNALHFRKIQEMAITDALTGVHNRRHFYERLASEWERFQRYDSVLSIIMADIDFFKKINDTYGHAAGDMVLINTARLLKKHLRRVDTVARYGGEEFVLLLPETDKEEAALVAERIREDIASKGVPWEGKDIHVTLSLGVEDANAVTKESRAEDVLRMADEKLYRAKQSGRNMVVSA